MSDLPPGWEWATFNDVTQTSLGKMLDKKQSTGKFPTPYLRNINVRWGSVDLSDVAFTNSLIRFQANDNVDPEWALLVFRAHMHSRRFMDESQITTNIAHLSAGRLKAVEFSIPPLAEQRERVRRARERLDGVDHLADGTARMRQHATALWQSILAAAFSGKLVPQDPSDEPASVLPERIHAKRATTKLARRPKAKT